MKQILFQDVPIGGRFKNNFTDQWHYTKLSNYLAQDYGTEWKDVFVAREPVWVDTPDPVWVDTVENNSK